LEKSEHIENLYRKYIEGTCSLQELDELLDAFGSGADEPLLRGIIAGHFKYEADESNSLDKQEELDVLDDHALAIADRVEARLFPLVREEKTTAAEPRRLRLWPRIAAAAAILIVVGAGLVLYVNKAKLDVNVGAAYANDIAPGKIGATLTLANGKKIRLADAANGEIAKEEGISVTKTKDGQIIYGPEKQASNENNDPSLQGTKNTLSTAKGETYILTLPDKSKVWLNAASSLTYSASLNERGLRRVRLEGEGYFEIAKDKAHPFIVESNGQQVEVLGTHFNVSAYGDDADVKTTLLEGSVRVNKNAILKPGQQAVLYDNKVRVLQVNAEDAIAWKDGLFIFEDEPLQSIMRKIERWYNVEVSYAKDVDQDKLYWGSVSRYDNVSRILKRLELTKNIHFKIEGRRITVMR